jgi:hypothetical protein
VGHAHLVWVANQLFHEEESCLCDGLLLWFGFWLVTPPLIIIITPPSLSPILSAASLLAFAPPFFFLEKKRNLVTFWITRRERKKARAETKGQLCLLYNVITSPPLALAAYLFLYVCTCSSITCASLAATDAAALASLFFLFQLQICNLWDGIARHHILGN